MFCASVLSLEKRTVGQYDDVLDLSGVSPFKFSSRQALRDHLCSPDLKDQKNPLQDPRSQEMTSAATDGKVRCGQLSSGDSPELQNAKKGAKWA